MIDQGHLFDLVTQAERDGFAGPAFEAVLNEPACKPVVLAGLNRLVDNALSTLEEADVFLWHLARSCDGWVEMLDEADLVQIANQMRGADVLRGQGGKQWRGGVKFQDLPWWPSA